MKSILFVGVSLALLAGVHFSGLLENSNVAHPFWRQNALIFGGLAGAALALLLLWLGHVKPGLGRKLYWIAAGVFVASLVTALYSASVFIQAEAFSATMFTLWQLASYAVFISFVVMAAALMQKIFGAGSASA